MLEKNLIKKIEMYRRDVDSALVDGIIRTGNINYQNMYGETILMKAIRWNDEVLLRMILDRDDVLIDLQDEYGDTALMKIFRNSAIDRFSLKIKYLKLLLEKGANPNIQNKSGYTVLMSAVMSNSEEAVSLLMMYGADIFLRTFEYNCTALSLAKSNSKEKIYEILKVSENAVILELDSSVTDSISDLNLLSKKLI